MHRADGYDLHAEQPQRTATEQAVYGDTRQPPGINQFLAVSRPSYHANSTLMHPFPTALFPRITSFQAADPSHTPRAPLQFGPPILPIRTRDANCGLVYVRQQGTTNSQTIKPFRVSPPEPVLLQQCNFLVQGSRTTNHVYKPW